MKTLLTLTVMTGLTMPLMAQDIDQDQVFGQDEPSGTPRAVLNSHRVSEEVSACINNLDEDCILTSGLNTVLDESLAVERVKVLNAMAQSLAETGDYARSRQLIDVAMEDVEQLRFAFIRRMKQVEIAPVLVLLGDVNGAIDMLSGFRGLDREKSVMRAIHMAARRGDVEGILRLRDALTMYKNRAAYFLMDAAETMVNTGYKEEARSLADRIRDDEIIRENPAALLRLAQVYYAVEDQVSAEAVYNYAETVEVDDYNVYSRFQSRLERVMYHFDDGNEAALGDALEDFSLSQKDLGSIGDRRNLAPFYARYYIKQGQQQEAIALTDLFNTSSTKADYLAKYALIPGASGGEQLTDLVSDILIDVTTLESVLERDDVRLRLLEAARTLGDLALSKAIVETLEDDDNAAKGLVLLLPLLKV